MRCLSLGKSYQLIRMRISLSVSQFVQDEASVSVGAALALLLRLYVVTDTQWQRRPFRSSPANRQRQKTTLSRH